jgi:hypothetical protein
MVHMPAAEYRQRALADMAQARSFYRRRGGGGGEEEDDSDLPAGPPSMPISRSISMSSSMASTSSNARWAYSIVKGAYKSCKRVWRDGTAEVGRDGERDGGRESKGKIG